MLQEKNSMHGQKHLRDLQGMSFRVPKVEIPFTILSPSDQDIRIPRSPFLLVFDERNFDFCNLITWSLRCYQTRIQLLNSECFKFALYLIFNSKFLFCFNSLDFILLYSPQSYLCTPTYQPLNTVPFCIKYRVMDSTSYTSSFSTYKTGL